MVTLADITARKHALNIFAPMLRGRTTLTASKIGFECIPMIGKNPLPQIQFIEWTFRNGCDSF